MTSGSIRSIGHRSVLDSHVGFTTEFIVELTDGTCGKGSSSRGETISIYEDRGDTVDPRRIVDVLRRDGIIGSQMDQVRLDRYLESRIGDFGKNTCFALSLAFFDAVVKTSVVATQNQCELPRLCLNVLNGGWHAYTNPVLSDFHEFLIVPRDTDLLQTIKEHDLVQRAVRERLLSNSKTVVSGNSVNVFTEKSNSAPVQFLVEVLEQLGLRDKFDLMIDASAGDLRTSSGYGFPITQDSELSSAELLSYWLEMVETYSLRFLEDPFQEEDLDAWKELTRQCGDRCLIVGDNLYSSEATRIEQGSRERYSTASIVKPNQAGTVSATKAAIEAAKDGGQAVIMSHRSISTESTFVCDMTCEYSAPYIKIGPLLSDYSSVVRLNRLIRLSGAMCD